MGGADQRGVGSALCRGVLYRGVHTFVTIIQRLQKRLHLQKKSWRCSSGQAPSTSHFCWKCNHFCNRCMSVTRNWWWCGLRRVSASPRESARVRASPRFSSPSESAPVRAQSAESARPDRPRWTPRSARRGISGRLEQVDGFWLGAHEVSSTRPSQGSSQRNQRRAGQAGGALRSFRIEAEGSSVSKRYPGPGVPHLA